jgi:nucleoside phosphorylase/SpoVK/Ycf46/Vps4 family AAA+-type ATPase
MVEHFRTAHEVRAELATKPLRALVITTVVHESRAVQSHLSGVEFVVGSNGAMYQFGTFSDPAGDWSVVHAICQAGNVDAAMTASGAYNDFGNFHVQIFVGVAGSLKEDVPIGSVVIGDYVYNSLASKVDDEGEYSRPHSRTAALELLQVATILVFDGSWVDLIKPPHLGSLPSVAEYPCPYPPVAQIKAIASGEQVVAGGNTPIYKKIRKVLNDAAAVEMEGWGAMSAAYMANTSAIVVRGISDICAGKDHVKDAQYQPIASAHAAAFAFSILSMRSRASPQDAQDPDPARLVNKQLVALATEPRVEFVVNFKGTLLDWPAEKIKSVIEGLRKTTGDPELTLVRVDQGSVRLVVKVREKDLPALTLEAVRTAAGDAGGQLLGAVTTSELIAAEDARAALRRASAGLLTWEQTLPGGGWLKRPERQQIESRFHAEFSSIIVLGEPGSGKSALLAAIATDLIQGDASVLAIKADFISPEVGSEQDLQRDLQLPAPPGELIEQLAQLQPVFLIVDQLDALASQLDLKSDRLNVLLNLVRRVGGLPNVHILISARSFEFNHDVRIRTIEAEAVTLLLPAWHEVKEQLTVAGIDADTWPENAREVVRNPQALKTYLSLAKANDDQPFSKYQSMLEQLWSQRVATAPDAEALASLASDVAGTMSEEETLWLAASRYDARARPLERLESVGLIVRSDNGKSIAFSHQTVFDYVLARSFVRAAGRLSSYVLERQNSLFVRAKLWSALRYLRDAEMASYEREFLEIWHQHDLRRHLRLLLIEFLGGLDKPVPFEQLCLGEVMQSAELRVAGLKSIAGSPGWFANFMRNAIPEAMARTEMELNQALRILQSAWPFAADDVVRLLREQWLPIQAKDSFTWAALDACTNWTDAIEEIAHKILLRTAVSTWHVDHMTSTIAVEQPDVAFRLIRAKLDFLLEKARAASTSTPRPNGDTPDEQAAWRKADAVTRPFIAILESTEWSSLSALAETEPQKFLETLWPWFRSIFDELRNRVQQDAPTYVFPGLYLVDVGIRDATDRSRQPEKPLLAGLCLAVECVAKENQAYFSNWARASNEIEFMAVQRLIAQGFLSAPKSYAGDALNWLFDDLRRLQLGNINSSRETTAALISAVSPYWTDQQVRAFEATIERYRPETPIRVTDAQGRKYFGQLIRTTKAHLLGAVAPDRLNDASRELLAVEKRALGENLERGIHLSGGGFIGSPMATSSMTKAKDRDILKMFAEVPDNANWDHPTRWMRGGNIQLSRAFAEFAKSEPIRALRIMEQFEPNNQERAAGYALESIAEVGGRDREIQDAILDLHQRGFSAEEFRSSAAHALEKMAKRAITIDERLIQVLAGWLAGASTGTEDSAEKEEAQIIETELHKRSQDERQQSLLWGHGGISFLPGGNFPILSALTDILLKGEGGRDRLLAILNDHFRRERNPKVWQALLLSLSNAGGSSPQVVSEFIRKLFARYPDLLETAEAVHFLAYAQRWDDVLVQDVIAEWGDAANPRLRQAHGELVGLISIVRRSERWTTMRDQLLDRGTEEAKIGLAYAAAHLWIEAHLHAVAGTLLERLIPGASKVRMAAILDVFRLCDDLVPEPTTLAFLRSLAAPEVDLSGAPSTFIVEKLQSLLPHAADVVGNIALKLVEAWRDELHNFQTTTAIAAPQLTDLAITLHRLGGVSRTIGVTVFEALIDMDAYGARDTLAEIDGRFGVNQTRPRRRIARRGTARAKRSIA